jgi:hypothetical protein
MPHSFFQADPNNYIVQCSYLGRIEKRNVAWRVLDDYIGGVWNMTIHVDGTPIKPWIDLDHTAATLQPNESKNLTITFGADDIVPPCVKNAKLYFHSNDYFKQETIIDATIHFLPVGIDELTTDNVQFTIYPNPTSGELKIENGELRINNVEVFDVYGRKQKAKSRKENEINISNLSAGIYFLRVDGKTVKVVKQ